MSRPAIIVDDLGKAYRIGLREEKDQTFREALVQAVQAPLRRFQTLGDRGTEADTFWALRNISFEVQPGEVVGIIGRNGAGKSTLLKVLSRITEPTEGCVRLRGRVSSLLEVGTGFHPELTGRENVYLNGAILGMSRREIARKFDEIVDFSGVEMFLDTPVKRYSSGMKVRLAFAVAAHLEPEILIIDEVLAVGDVGFQKRCLGQMRKVATRGRTVLFVSHSMSTVASLCGRCIHIDRDSAMKDGHPADVISGYLCEGATDAEVDLRNWDMDRTGDGPMRVVSVQTTNHDDVLQSHFCYGDTIHFRFVVEGKPGTECIVGVAIRDPGGNTVLHLNNTDDKRQLILANSRSRFNVELSPNILNDGTYYVTIWLGDSLNTLHDRVGNCLSFTVNSSVHGDVRSRGLVRLTAGWSVD